MSPADILDHNRKRPFEPYVLVVSDGSTYEVAHPELCMVALTTVTVAIPTPKIGPPVADRHLIDAFHIVKLLPLPRPAGGLPQPNGTPQAG